MYGEADSIASPFLFLPHPRAPVHKSAESPQKTMQLDVQTFLNLAEASGQIACFDIEATGLKADFGTFLCGVIKPYGKPAKTFCVKRPGDDKKAVSDFCRELSKYACLVSYNGKRYDISFLRTRLLKHGKPPLKKQLHLDVYQVNKTKLNMSRRSQLQLLGLLETEEQKMGVSPNTWAEVAKNKAKNLAELKRRCKSDVEGLEQAYKRMRGLIENITVA